MTEGRNGQGGKNGTKAPANDVPASRIRPHSAHMTTSHMTTSPAFDRWLELQMKILFAAAESPPDPRLLELIRQAFPNAEDKVTE
ncbi:hypothetical protein [Dongia sp.]|uniref:hypothetical protein n=1 Tax=Dongia sp. TaxID=1977262 RepID=UPI0035B36A0E